MAGSLESPVALFILPLFILVNAGAPIKVEFFIESIQHPTGMGIILGLVVAKFIGVSDACWLGLHYLLIKIRLQDQS
jgi:NhaA family Na+:H+ antiporter